MVKRRLWLCLSVGILCASGCKTAALRDDIELDLRLSFSPLSAVWKSDTLHLPYVTGAKVNITLDDDAGADMTDWRFESSDPSVLAIQMRDTRVGTMSARVTAGREGAATVRAYDTLGRQRYAYEIPVVAPDRVQLSPHADLLLRMSATASRVEEARILAGGTATYLVRYYRGNRRLNGNGALIARPPSGVIAEPRTTFLFENQEWLSLTPNGVGAQSVELFAGATPLGRFAVMGVQESALQRIVLEGEDEGRARRGDWLNVVAKGVDPEGRTVLGLDCEWTMEGDLQGASTAPWARDVAAVGDLYRYEYRGDLTKSLTANLGQKDATAILHAGLGYVSSTNKLGCAAGGDDVAGLISALCVLGAALLVSRRARSRRRASTLESEAGRG